MTLAAFPPDRLDALALRLLDLATMVRKMSNDSRENDVGSFELHGQKIDEWLGHLEDWAHDGTARMQTAIIRQAGKNRALSASAAPESRGGKRGAKKGR